MKIKSIILVALLICLPAFGQNESFKAKCIRVLDGDTIEVSAEGNVQKIRVNGIDCPESDQEYGPQATGVARALLLSQTVLVVATGADRYGRLLANIKYGPLESLDYAEQILERGLAWHYKQYNDEERLSLCEQKARGFRYGLWGSSATPVPPWEYRKAPKAGVSSSSVETDYKGRTILTGPRGGRYYINKNGNKTYVKRRK